MRWEGIERMVRVLAAVFLGHSDVFRIYYPNIARYLKATIYKNGVHVNSRHLSCNLFPHCQTHESGSSIQANFPLSDTRQSPRCPSNSLRSAEYELFGHGRARQVRIEQHTVQKIFQASPPFLQKRRAEFVEKALRGQRWHGTARIRESY